MSLNPFYFARVGTSVGTTGAIILDMSQVWLVIIGAAIGAVTKEAIAGIVALVRNTAAAQTFKQKLAVIFSKESRAVMFDVVFIVALLAFMLSFALSDSPATRRDVAFMAGAAVLLVLLMISLFHDVVVILVKRDVKRNPLRGS